MAWLGEYFEKYTVKNSSRDLLLFNDELFELKEARYNILMNHISMTGREHRIVTVRPTDYPPDQMPHVFIERMEGVSTPEPRDLFRSLFENEGPPEDIFHHRLTEFSPAHVRPDDDCTVHGHTHARRIVNSEDVGVAFPPEWEVHRDDEQGNTIIELV